MIFDARARQVLEEYAPLGQRLTASGAKLIGHVPHRGPHAFLHIVFPPAKQASIAGFRTKTSATQAFDIYSTFLSESNGAMFFLGSLAFNGIREGPLLRSAEDRHPFDLGELNRFERPKNADPCSLFVGSYNQDGSLVYVEPDGQVFACRRGDATPYSRWSSLETMVSEELLRMTQFYDRDGRLIDQSARRTPAPNI